MHMQFRSVTLLLQKVESCGWIPWVNWKGIYYLFSLTPCPEAMDRIHRLGQHRPVQAIKLVIEDSIESRIVQVCAHLFHSSGYAQMVGSHSCKRRSLPWLMLLWVLVACFHIPYSSADSSFSYQQTTPCVQLFTALHHRDHVLNSFHRLWVG